MIDDRIGLTIVNFNDSSLLQVSGRAAVEFLADGTRSVSISIRSVLHSSASAVPLKWQSTPRSQPLVVRDIVDETADVKSVLFVEAEGRGAILDSFAAGDYLTMFVPTSSNTVLTRTYSISSSPSNRQMYRITVKKDPNGIVSRYIHDNLQIGTEILVKNKLRFFMFLF